MLGFYKKAWKCWNPLEMINMLEYSLGSINIYMKCLINYNGVTILPRCTQITISALKSTIYQKCANSNRKFANPNRKSADPNRTSAQIEQSANPNHITCCICVFLHKIQNSADPNRKSVNPYRKYSNPHRASANPNRTSAKPNR